MARANLKGHAEVTYLRKMVRLTFESQDNRTLVANTNKGNYIRLAEEISKTAQSKALGTSLESMDMTVSEGQVRSLFMESNKDFLDYFVQACYLYVHGIGREAFLSLPENSAAIIGWEQENLEKYSGFSENEKALQQENTVLENQIERLRKRTKQWTLTAILVLGSTLFALFFVFKQNKKALKKLNTWTGNLENIEKDNLLPYLDFLKPESGFLTVVDTMIQSLYTPSVFYNPEATLPIVPYKRIVATSGYIKYGNSFYPDQISIIPLHGFSVLQFDSILTKTQGMASVLFKRYSHFAHQNGETHVSKDILAKIMALDDSDFDVDLIYLGYKKDIDIFDSDDFVLRYPPYKYDESGLQNYVMTNRQWWQEAINKKGIHWEQNFSGRLHNCGISKPYPTVRTNAPNQRTFWVELAPDTLNDKIRMVLAIDLILKNS